MRETHPNLFTCLIKELYIKGSTNVNMPWRVPLLYHLFLFVLHNEGASSALGAIEGPVFRQFKLIFSQLNTEKRTKQQEPTRAGADGRGMHGDVDNNRHSGSHSLSIGPKGPHVYQTKQIFKTSVISCFGCYHMEQVVRLLGFSIPFNKSNYYSSG